MKNCSHRISLTIIFLLVSGCSSPLLSKKDYRNSLNAHYDGRPASALNYFPRGESGNFITTMEKTYLNLIQGKADTAALQRYASLVENRVRYDISREAASFFYVKMPEDYYASEHEIIWMHLLLSWGFSLRNEYEKGCIEARKAAHLLSYSWSDEGHFDDPALRIFLAGMWAMCGSWEDAQVDLRAAWQLDNSLNWAKELGDQRQPPEELLLILGGVGPIPTWQPEGSINPIRGARKVEFRYRGKRSKLSVVDQQQTAITTHITPNSAAWYERHLVRDNAIHELITDSRYGANMLIEGSILTSKTLAYTAAGVGIAVGGSALGGLVLYLGAEAQSEELVKLGLVIIAGSVLKGVAVIDKGVSDSKKTFQQQIDPTEQYRFVRYLPEYFWLGWSNEKLHYPLTINANWKTSKATRTRKKGRPAVTLLHINDSPPSYKNPLGSSN